MQNKILYAYTKVMHNLSYILFILHFNFLNIYFSAENKYKLTCFLNKIRIK
ncbi:protein of unknown function [Bartonella clarridgeiae 73]|uniref:Uncharacterized protein n=1 Tax=Bartonella clarridgeiae (strain CCUG 45776 / CIP 104772 / 73) TaxID=696125 RepID=E6YGG1_BARC7|nr:protein of unknown function [Bartonella clarridgeiae 73]